MHWKAENQENPRAYHRILSLPGLAGIGWVALLGITAFSLLGCSGRQSNIRTEFYATKIPKYEIAYKGEVKHGPEVWWYANGRKKYEGTNADGLRDGAFTGWYENGQPWYSGEERDGRKVGIWKFHYDNGVLESLVHYDATGKAVKREDFERDGSRKLTEEEKTALREKAVEDQKQQELQGALKLWSFRIRKAVESRWSPPKTSKPSAARAVATLKINRQGRVVDARLVEKSRDAAFDQAAQRTLKQLKQLPPPPAEHPKDVLEIQYEFVYKGSNRSQSLQRPNTAPKTSPATGK